MVRVSTLMTKMARTADDALAEQLGQHARTIRAALGALARRGPGILDETLPEQGRRATLFAHVPRDERAARGARATEWVSGRQRDSLHGVVTRYGTLRRVAPAFLEAVSCLQEDGSEKGPCLQALEVLRDLNASNTRTLPTGTSTEFFDSVEADQRLRRRGEPLGVGVRGPHEDPRRQSGGHPRGAPEQTIRSPR